MTSLLRESLADTIPIRDLVELISSYLLPHPCLTELLCPHTSHLLRCRIGMFYCIISHDAAFRADLYPKESLRIGLYLWNGSWYWCGKGLPLREGAALTSYPCRQRRRWVLGEDVGYLYDLFPLASLR